MRVLVTGHQGYIGSMVAEVLQAARFEVVGLDIGWNKHSRITPETRAIPTMSLDMRDVEYTHLLAFDAVVHLAGLSGDACCDLDPTFAQEINHEATVRLAECCRKAEVERMVFMSSCAVYGQTGSGLADEFTTPQPHTLYARTKLAAELELQAMTSQTFTPIIMRAGTAYGVSPVMRLDTAINEFVANAVTTGRLTLRSPGYEWRPMIHVEDIARVVRALLVAPAELVRGQVYNVARPAGNIQLMQVAEMISSMVTGCELIHAAVETAPRSYQVDTSRLMNALPRLRLQWDLADGIRQLAMAFERCGLTEGDVLSGRFHRLSALQQVIEQSRPAVASLQTV